MVVNQKNKGFSAIEIILTVALFGLIVVGMTSSFLISQEATNSAGNHTRALLYAEEGLEAVSNIKESDFALIGDLPDDTYYLDKTTGQWTLEGNSDIFDIFTRSITLTTQNDDVKEVTSNVAWMQNQKREGQVSLVTRLSNWISTIGEYSWNFDGVDEYIDVPDADVFSFGDSVTDSPFSVSVWAKVTPINSSNYFFTKGNAGGNVEYSFDRLSNVLRFRLFDGNTSNDIELRTPATGIFEYFGYWSHYVATYDGTGVVGGMKIYINGVLQTASTGFNSGTYVAMHNASSPLGIGRSNALYNTGLMAEPIVFNKKLSGAEVLEIYNGRDPRNEMEESLAGNVVGYWRGGNSTNIASGVLDQTGNNNHGTMTNMEDADIDPDFPRPGSEFSWLLDGANEYINATDNALLSFGNGVTDRPFSLSVWVKPDSISRFRIFDKASTTVAQDREYVFSTGSAGRPAFILYDIPNTITISRTGNAGTDLVVGEWTHLVATYNGNGLNTGMKIYRNGVLAPSTAGATGTYVAMHDTAFALNLGRFSGNYANGKQADYVVWDKELSASEVTAIYNNGEPRNEATQSLLENIVLYYRGKYATNTANGVLDQSGNAINGTMTNMESSDILDDYPGQ